MKAAALTGARAMTYVGVLAYSSDEFAATAALIARGEVDLPPVISEVVSVDATSQAFARLSDGRNELRKIIVSPDA